jgi:hypothetical protein
VARVVAALEPNHAMGVLGQPVDDLALALVTPLGADNDDVFAHGRLLPMIDISWASGHAARPTSAAS